MTIKLMNMQLKLMKTATGLPYKYLAKQLLLLFSTGLPRTVLPANDAYTPPLRAGLWVPTPPGFGKVSAPYFGNLRPLVVGITNNTQPGAPLAYSEDAQSPFY